MTKVDARKILGISGSAGLKPAELAYHQKRQMLHFRMLPGNPCADRRQAQSELVKLTDAWKVMQTKGSTRKRPTKPRATVNRQNPAKITNVWDLIHELAENWKILVGMTSFSKKTALAILIAEFVLVMIIIVLKSMKGA